MEPPGTYCPNSSWVDGNFIFFKQQDFFLPAPYIIHPVLSHCVGGEEWVPYWFPYNNKKNPPDTRVSCSIAFAIGRNFISHRSFRVRCGIKSEVFTDTILWRSDWKETCEEQKLPWSFDCTPEIKSHLLGIGTIIFYEILPLCRAHRQIIRNFTEMLRSGHYSDLTIKVQDKKFLVHKIVLRQRCQVFLAMFSHSMEESNTGVLEVEDVDSEIFKKFLRFLYTGQVSSTGSEAAALYVVADKYHVDELKEICLGRIVDSLSSKLFLKAYLLSKKYEIPDLYKACARYFARHSKEVSSCKKWQREVDRKPEEASEFFEYVRLQIKEELKERNHF